MELEEPVDSLERGGSIAFISELDGESITNEGGSTVLVNASLALLETAFTTESTVTAVVPSVACALSSSELKSTSDLDSSAIEVGASEIVALEVA